MEGMTTPDTITQWCNANNYTEPHLVEGKWWAFADGAVMAVPLAAELSAKPPTGRDRSAYSFHHDRGVSPYANWAREITERPRLPLQYFAIIGEIDLEPSRHLGIALSDAFSPFRDFFKSVDLNKYIEKLLIDKARKERDRRWKDDPLQLKAQCIDPVVEHFRSQTVHVLEWMLEKVKR